MTAVDTNVLVRLLTGDEPSQAAAARRLFASEPIWIAETDAIRDALTKLLGLKNVHAEEESSVAAALALTAHGIELADAMHLCGRPPGARFVSFDKPFIRRAGRAGVSDISAL
jgi:predicted nucleic acid-binding protein